MTLLVPIRTYNLGNALSVLGNGVLLAERLQAKLFFPQFAKHLPLFEEGVERYGGVTEEEAAYALSRMKTTRVTSSAYKESLLERPRIKADEYFAYLEIADETLLVVRQQSYFSPLEALDQGLVRRFRLAFLYQPYQLSHQDVTPVDDLRRQIRLLPERVAAAEAVNAEARGERERLIGVHVRLGDYRTWRDGRYAYELADILPMLRSMERRSPGLYAFRFFSNDCGVGEVERLAASAPELRIYFEPADTCDDFCGLSRCDVVFGPPSSFSHWAAFLGARPRLVFDNPLIQRLCVTRRYLEALPPVSWPFSVGLQNDFWVG